MRYLVVAAVGWAVVVGVGGCADAGRHKQATQKIVFATVMRLLDGPQRRVDVAAAAAHRTRHD